METDRKLGLGIEIPEVMLPDNKVNMRKWAVIACDQYTVNKEYWAEVERTVGAAPSALHIMLPEIYLGASDTPDRITRAKSIMTNYIDDGILTLLPAGFVLVERYINHKIRKGLLVNVDLEQFDANPLAKPVIRPSEEILYERVEPRIDIRMGAELEMPHLLLLMDDPLQQVIEPVWKRRENFSLLYDFDLMMGGGRIKGYLIDDKAVEGAIVAALSGLKTRGGMRFCVGDGNHSLATAKEVWEQTKRSLSLEEQEKSPLRYAMCELLNIHDPGLEIKPIHRIVSGIPSSTCIQYVVDKLNAIGADARLVFSRRKPAAQFTEAPQVIFFTSKDSTGRIEIYSPTASMLVEVIQPVLESLARDIPQAFLEYIHGDEELDRVTADYDTLGFIMPAMKKSTFFDDLITMGLFPKKCFSIGEARDKRFYIECRLLSNPEPEPLPEAKTLAGEVEPAMPVEGEEQEIAEVQEKVRK